MRHGTWFNNFEAEGKAMDLPARTREELEKLDDALFAIWNLGDNVLLGWTFVGWVAALIWAFTAARRADPAARPAG